MKTLPRMVGRDPHEPGRIASPLELLFDLTFVIAVGVSASRFADVLAEGHVIRGVLAFALALFAILIAWINFTWFASAFDTDDWAYRLLTMVQMIGVVIFALGLPRMFETVNLGRHLDVRVMVIGYVVMRVGLLAQWKRAAHQSPKFKGVAERNIAAVGLAQVGWVLVAFLPISTVVMVVAIVPLGVGEFLVPVVAQGRANGTPWHPHHIADRYGAFALIVLGEGVVGTVATSQGLLGGATGIDWSWQVVLVVIAGISLTFGMWWAYFITPFGDLLHHRSTRGYVFGYGHIPIFAAIAATGAGLHLAGIYLGRSGHHHISEQLVVLAVAIPVCVYTAGVYALYQALFSSRDVLHIWLILGTVLVLVLAVLLGIAGVNVAICLVMISFAPFVTVIGYEAGGGREHQAAHLRSVAVRQTDRQTADRTDSQAAGHTIDQAAGPAGGRSSGS